MKKILKGLSLIAVALICVFTFSACKGKVSPTSTDISGSVYGGALTSGGITAVHDGYLYFINGTKTNDGKNLKKTTEAALCRVKIADDGTIDANTYEVVVDSLIGYDYGSIHFFGNYIYYATPNSAVNYQDSVLYNQTKFMRYDLSSKKKHTLYTTKKNSSDEKISYAYYIVGEELELVVYEQSNATVTSIKVDKKSTVNYVISEVTSCVLSDNYGRCETLGQEKDANNFVFYTKSYTDTDAIKSSKVYRTAPNADTSERIYNESPTISILSIRNGRLYYSLSDSIVGDSIVYSKTITGTGDVLNANAPVISYSAFSNIIFYNDNSLNITAIALNDSNEVLALTRNPNNDLDIKSTCICTLPKSTSSSSSSSSSSEQKEKVSFVGLVTLTETIKDDDLEEGEEPETEQVVYLIYVDTDVLYKLEIIRDGEIQYETDRIKLTKSVVSTPTNYLSPEVIGNYIYFFANEVGADEKATGKVYLHRTDVTVLEDSDKYAEVVKI